MLPQTDKSAHFYWTHTHAHTDIQYQRVVKVEIYYTVQFVTQ